MRNPFGLLSFPYLVIYRNETGQIRVLDHHQRFHHVEKCKMAKYFVHHVWDISEKVLWRTYIGRIFKVNLLYESLWDYFWIHRENDKHRIQRYDFHLFRNCFFTSSCFYLSHSTRIALQQTICQYLIKFTILCYYSLVRFFLERYPKTRTSPIVCLLVRNWIVFSSRCVYFPEAFFLCRMGRLFKTYLSGSTIYCCSTCKCHLAIHEDIMSKVTLTLLFMLAVA